MAKSQKKLPKRIGGPYLATAVFCDSVVQGADGAMSAVRIIDRVTLNIPEDAPPDVPSAEKMLPINLWGLISFKRGMSKKSHRVQLVIQSPTGDSQTLGESRIVFGNEPYSGANLRMNFHILIKKGGLFWLDVIMDGVTVTSMPLQVSISRIPIETGMKDVTAKPAKSNKPAKSK